jgi:hypothetical protein
MEITFKSSAFAMAEELVRPIIRDVPADKLFDFIESVEQAIAAAADPPEWLCAQDADRYSKRRWRMAFVGKDRPPYRPLGQVNFYRRGDIDAWAVARIESRPVVEHVR